MDPKDFAARMAAHGKKIPKPSSGKVMEVMKGMLPKKHEAIGMGLAGLVGAAGGYFASKPSKKDGLSAEQKLSRKTKPKSNGDDGMAKGLGKIYVKTYKDIANLSAQNPKSAALVSALMAAPIGKAIANKLVKESSAAEQFLKIADDWGRELAQEHHTDLEKLYAATEKIAETEKDRAHKWGKRGALANLAIGGLQVASNVPKNKLLQSAMKAHPGEAAKFIAGRMAGKAGVGYIAGRAAHRLHHGYATDKQVKKSKEKKAAGLVGHLGDAAKAIASKAIKKPGVQRALVGAGTGAALNMASGDRNRSVVGDATRGAVVGYAAGPLARKLKSHL